uniref:Zinc finger and BTB domain-containing protein 16-like n=1 Tax=Callorhinchus milii TaxID=7868 RepID=A0A4W3GXK6_CALMI
MAVFCLLCGKRFQTQIALQQHMDVHAGVRSYICSECNRTFPSHTALKRHLRSHTGDHPYECEFCGSCFRDECTLKSHKRIHTGEKPYECNGCGKKFSLKHQLETHYRVHTGEKPFECKLCHQRSQRLLRHDQAFTNPQWGLTLPVYHLPGVLPQPVCHAETHEGSQARRHPTRLENRENVPVSVLRLSLKERRIYRCEC